ncbi:MAG: hypothetical protein IJK81_08800 [Selenomonadaceae bacterium]|nr:hypothetical protein [Selenomonadaceae bacterium]
MGKWDDTTNNLINAGYDTTEQGFICKWDNSGSLDEIVGYTTKSSDALLTSNFDEPNNVLNNVTFAKSDNKK